MDIIIWAVRFTTLPVLSTTCCFQDYTSNISQRTPRLMVVVDMSSTLPALRLEPPQPFRSRATTRARRSSCCTSSSSSSIYYSASSSTIPVMDPHPIAHQRFPSSSATASSPAVAMPPLHINSFGHLGIADFDNKGRYPTTPSLVPRRASSYLDQSSATSAAAAYVPQREQWESPFISSSTRQPQLSPSQDTNSDIRNAQQCSPIFDSPMQGSPSGYPGRSSVRSRPSTKSNDGEDKQGQSPPLTTTPNPIQRPLNDTQQTVSQQQYIPKSPPHNPPLAGISGPRHPQAPSRPQPTNRPSGVSQSNMYLQQPQVPPQGVASPTAQQPSVRPAQPFNGPYPSMIPPQQMQNVYRPPNAAPPEEICIECMMRDRDMADVDVISPGTWERESDAPLRELIEREDDNERRWYEEHATELAQAGHGLRPPKRKSKGHRLTEQNLKIWLSMVSRVHFAFLRFSVL